MRGTKKKRIQGWKDADRYIAEQGYILPLLRKMAAKTRNPLHKQQLEDMARAWEMLLGLRWKQVERRLRRGPLERARIKEAHSTRRC